MVTVPHTDTHERGFDMVTVAPLTESVGAIAIIVLSVIGLAGTAEGAMLAIATIVIGASILMQGANTVSEYAELFVAEEAGMVKPGAIGGGITLEFLAGGAGVVLGILGLLTPVTVVLSAAALVVFGGTLLLSAGATVRASSIQSDSAGMSVVTQSVMRQATSVSAGAQIMIGVGAIVLGILALIGLHSVILALVGDLAIGTSLLMVSAGNSVAGLMRRA
ncbi:MAG TPA: hypothetical protein VKV32_19085 [Stellaceae bacterium]|nr:hypothetical protein [Stellaceae bacterium]